MTRRVVFDTSFLAPFLDPTTPIRPVPGLNETGQRVRLTHFFGRCDAERAEILIPTPALAELLTLATREPQPILDLIDRQARFRIVPFDRRAATECSHLIRSGFDLAKSSRKPRGLVKFDAMILAIAVVEGATTLCTDDDDLRTLAERQGLSVFGLADLPPPPQPELPFDVPSPG